MNTQRLAAPRISPLHVQQGLFASLALLITLIIVQQFTHWTQHQDVPSHPAIAVHSAPFAKASALKATDVGLTLQSVESAAAPINEAPRQQSWVF